MNRLAACAAVGICTSMFACASSGPKPDIAGLPADCTPHSGGTVELQVNDLGQVSENCIAVYRDYTDIVWRASSNARQLIIIFKDKTHNPGGFNPPPDPPPAGVTAKLKKGKTASVQPHDDGYPYSVIVILKDGSAHAFDPRLIIRP